MTVPLAFWVDLRDALAAIVALAKRAAPIAAAAAVLASCAGRSDAAPPALAGAGSPARRSAAAPPSTSAPASSGVDGAARCDVAFISACVGESPSFATEVKPILERRCYRCHAAGGVAADDHDLSDLATLRAQRAALTDAITTCSMPPRTPLSQDDARALLRWLACGARAE